MTVQTKPLFAGSVNSPIKNISVALNNDALIASPADSTSLRLLFTATENGGYLEAVEYQGIGTGTCGLSVMQLWLTDNTGANAQVWRSIAVSAGSGAMSTTNPGVWNIISASGANIEIGCKIFVSFKVLATNVTYNVTAWAGQFKAQP
jgi:hypothetical protein